MIRLWTINRWLRWTGFRIHFWVPDAEDRKAGKQTLVGIGWYGLYGSDRWRRIEPSKGSA